MSSPIAIIYPTDGRPTRVVPTRPGVQVRMIGGAGKVYNARDMPALLRRQDISISLEDSQAFHLPQWVAECGEFDRPRAVVRIHGDTQDLQPPDYALPPALESETELETQTEQPPAAPPRSARLAARADHEHPATPPSDAVQSILDGWEPPEE